MKCEEAEAMMAGLLLGEIAPEHRKAVEEHLMECARCRADFERARLGGQVEWPDRPVPGPLAEAALAAIRRPVPVLRFLRWATAAAAALCVALLGILAARPPIPREAAKPPSFAAMMKPTGLGSLVAQDEEGRPVGELGLRSHAVEVEILDGIAKTTVEENFENHTDRRLEGTFHFPLPADASISRLALEVNGKIEEGTCLERERAREVFETIVRRMQDPALLEWMPGGIFKCRVFPIEPRSTKRVIVAYTQALPFFRGRLSYVYPLASEKTRTHPPGEVRIEARGRFSGKLAKVESTSHSVDVQRRDEHEARMVFSARNYRPQEDFVLVMETEDEEVRVVPHKADGEDGYFALFLTPRGEPRRQLRKYVFILDISASVSGPELDVAKRLVEGMMQRGIPGDRFEILAHNVEIERSGDVDARAAGEFLERLRPLGGSDVLKALLAVPEGEIIYIGEGTPTMGETDPAKILEAVKGRRIRTIGVGSDANVPLLERLGAHFQVSPNDHVARRVEEIASTMGCEALRGLRIGGGEAVYDVVGVRDLFYGERLAIVGRYRGPAEKIVVAAGDYRREVPVTLPPKEEGNNYVRRLWAQRKVAELLARGGSKDEVTALGVKYQIMTPYTSFLVLESEEMWKQYNLKREVQGFDEVLGRRPGEFEEFALKRLEEATGRSLEEVGVEAGALDRLAQARGGEEGRRVQELTEKYRNLAMSQFGGRMKVKPSATPQEVEERLRRYREGEPSPEPAHAPAPQAHRFVAAYDDFLDDVGIELGVSNTSRRIQNADSAARELEVENQRSFITILNEKNNTLDTENSAKAARMGNLRRQLDDAITEKAKMAADQDVLVRQLEVQLAQIQEMALKSEEYRSKIMKSLNEKSTTVSQLQYDRQLVERLQRDLAEMEEKYVETAREKKLLEDRINHLNQMGIRTEVAPKRALEGKVTAVAPEIGLVVISIGKDTGVGEGDEFTIYRGGDFVAKVVIDRADRKWAAGKIVLKKVDPRPADDVSNYIQVPPPFIATEVVAAGGTPDEVILGAGSKAGLRRGHLLAVTRDGKFVAMVTVLEVSEDRAKAAVWRGMAVGRAIAGDRAERVESQARYLASLPREVRLDLASKVNLEGIRSKMEVKP